MTASSLLHWKTALHILLLALACALVYWPSLDVQFNQYAWDYGLMLLYYCTGAILALGLSLSLWLFFDKLKVFVHHLLLALACIYWLVSLSHIFLDSCEVQKNPNLFYKTIIALLLTLSAYTLLFKIRPKMSLANLWIVAMALGIFLTDALVFWWGYRLFWEGIWG